MNSTRVFARLWRRLVTRACAVVGLLTGCGGGSSVAPTETPTTYAEAAGEVECVPGEPASPFIVDLPPDQRGDIELLMKRQLVAVAYDCKKLVVLPDCEVGGEYFYAGLTPREQVISIVDDVEMHANLPLGGSALLGQVGGDFERGNTLDIALAIVGQKAGVKRTVARSELKGQCSGATHFIRSALVGAFAMEKGSRGRVKTAAEVFGIGASAQSAKTSRVINRDGSLEACRKGGGNDSELAGCAAPLRVELSPLLDEAQPASEQAALEEEQLVPHCPRGTRADDSGKCVRSGTGGPYVCNPNDPMDCAKQCGSGSMVSCTILARSYQIGRGVDVDVDKAIKLYVRACKGGSVPACGRVGEMLLGAGKEKDGLELLRRACSSGWGEGCWIAGRYLIKAGKGGEDAFAGMLRGCKMGKAESCWDAGFLLTSGLMPKDEVQAARFFELSCEGGARRGCASYAEALANGLGVPKNESAAVALATRSCDQGFAASCSQLAMFYFLGKGVAQDEAQGVALLERACESPEREQCLTIGMRYKYGKGVAKDPVKAERYFARACEGGMALACADAQKLGVELSR